MRLRLINSAWAQAGRDTAWGIRKTKELGFDSIDVFTDPLVIDVRERRLIKDECDRAGLPIVSVCCVAVGLVDFNPSVRRFHVERAGATGRLCCQCGAGTAVEALWRLIVTGALALATKLPVAPNSSRRPIAH